MQSKPWSINALAHELEMDRRTLTSRLKDVPPAGRQRGLPVYSLASVVRALIGHAVGVDGAVDPHLERGLLDRARREQVEMINAERRKELLPAGEVLLAWTTLVTNAKSKLRALPVKLARGNTELLELARAGVDEALEELASDGIPTWCADDSGEGGAGVEAAAETDDRPVGGRRKAAVRRGQRRARKVAD